MNLFHLSIQSNDLLFIIFGSFTLAFEIGYPNLISTRNILQSYTMTYLQENLHTSHTRHLNRINLQTMYKSIPIQTIKL
jgi:hypothetical protein